MVGHLRSALRLLLAGGLLLLSSAAQAQLTRYVASTGNDANPCTSPAAPCRTLQRGIISAPAGGLVQLLGSVDGDATIDRSLTLSGGGFTVTGSIVVNSANAAVVLRDLHIVGTNTPSFGIYVIAASAVHVDRCIVERSDAIVSDGPNVELFVTDRIVRNNDGHGIIVYDADADFYYIGAMTLTVDIPEFAEQRRQRHFLARHKKRYDFANRCRRQPRQRH